jgi:hypothetical protein
MSFDHYDVVPADLQRQLEKEFHGAGKERARA